MSRAKRMKIEKIRGLLGLARRSRGLTVGSRETRTNARRGEVWLILLSSDGSARDRERLERVAEEEEIPARIVGTREEIGEAIGQGEVSVVGIKDRNLAGGVWKRLEESEDRAGDGSGKPGGDRK